MPFPPPEYVNNENIFYLLMAICIFCTAFFVAEALYIVLEHFWSKVKSQIGERK